MARWSPGFFTLRRALTDKPVGWVLSITFSLSPKRAGEVVPTGATLTRPKWYSRRV